MTMSTKIHHYVYDHASTDYSTIDGKTCCGIKISDNITVGMIEVLTCKRCLRSCVKK